MFSQFTSFASKLTAELSLDNLQKDEEEIDHGKKSFSSSHTLSIPSSTISTSSSSSIPSSTTPIPPLSLNSPSESPQSPESSTEIESSSTVSHHSPSDSFSIVPHLQRKEITEETEHNKMTMTQFEVLLSEKDQEISRLTARLSTCQEDLYNAINRLQIETNTIQSLEESLVSYRRREIETDQLIKIFEAKNKDLELELSELQALYQTKFSESQTHSDPCVSCLSYEKQIEDLTQNIETIEINHKNSLETMNKKISKLQKINKKLEKDLQNIPKVSESQQTQQTQTQEEPQQLVEDSPKPTEVSPKPVEISLAVIDEKESELERFRQNLIDKDNQISLLQSNFDQIQSEYHEMKEKQLTLTSKMKEKVKKFIDSQTQLENEKIQLTNLLQNKDSDIENLQKKIQTLEANLIERKKLSTELSDRYSDAQRELKKRKDELSLLGEQINQLNELLAEKDDQLSRTKYQLTDSELERTKLLEMNRTFDENSQLVDRKVQDLESANKELRSIIELKTKNIEEQSVISQSLMDTIDDLKKQITFLEKEKETRLREHEEKSKTLCEEIEKIRQNNHSFDEYKLRAQKTLKQANTTVNSLTTQLSACQEEIQKLQQQNHQLQEGNGSRLKEIHRLQCEIDELRNSQNAKVIEFEDKIRILQETITKLTLEKDSYQLKIEGMTKANNHQQKYSNRHIPVPQPLPSPSPEVVVVENDEVVLKSDEEGVLITKVNHSVPENKLKEPVVLDDASESTKLKVPDHSGDLYIVHQLRETITDLHQEISEQHHEIEELKLSLQQERENKGKVIRQLEELNAFHERTKKLLNSPESAVNIEYLKTCVYRLMVTKELSEKRRLYPVISVILKFTPQETSNVNKSIEEVVAAENDGSWFTPSTLGSFFGSS